MKYGSSFLKLTNETVAPAKPASLILTSSPATRRVCRPAGTCRRRRQSACGAGGRLLRRASRKILLLTRVEVDAFVIGHRHRVVLVIIFGLGLRRTAHDMAGRVNANVTALHRGAGVNILDVGATLVDVDEGGKKKIGRLGGEIRPGGENAAFRVTGRGVGRARPALDVLQPIILPVIIERPGSGVDTIADLEPFQPLRIPVLDRLQPETQTLPDSTRRRYSARRGRPRRGRGSPAPSRQTPDAPSARARSQKRNPFGDPRKAGRKGKCLKPPFPPVHLAAEPFQRAIGRK